MACEYTPEIGVIDFLISSFLVTGFMFTASQKARKLIPEKPHYKNYVKGLAYKLSFSVIFLLLFIYYYRGGDTLAYHEGAIAMKNLFFYDPPKYFRLLFGPISRQEYVNSFNYETCYPPTWMIKKEANFTVIRVASVLQIFLGDSIMAPNLIFARIAYTPLFKLYGMFVHYFPGKQKPLATAVLFMPSVAIWGSGIMKDTITMTAICWLTVLFNEVAIQKLRLSLTRFTGMAFAVFMIYMVKSYLLLAMAPGLLIWFNFQRILAIKSTFVKAVLFPALSAASFAAFLWFYTSNSELFGVYGAEKVFDEAAKVQQDLVREEAYGANKFDIGAFEPTLAGVSSKIPAAVTAGLFRPFIWESTGGFTILFAGLENTYILILFILALLRRKVLGFFSYTFSHPLLILGFIFTLFLSFSIGLTTANFGALVRYKIPLVPFFMAILLLNFHKNGTKAE
jgi:hypothetical protein